MNPERRLYGIDLNLGKLLESMAKRFVGTRNVSGKIRYVISVEKNGDIFAKNANLGLQ